MMANSVAYCFEIIKDNRIEWRGNKAESLLHACDQLSNQIFYKFNDDYAPDLVHLCMRVGDNRETRKTFDQKSSIKISRIYRLMKLLEFGFDYSSGYNTADVNNRNSTKIIKNLDVLKYAIVFSGSSADDLSLAEDIQREYKDTCDVNMGCKRRSKFNLLWFFDDSIDPLIEKMKYGDVIEIIDLDKSSKYLDHKIDSY